MALRITDAARTPPVHSTGTVSACLILRASGRLAPSILSFGTPACSHCSLKIGPVTAPRNNSRLRNVCVPLDASCSYTLLRTSIGRLLPPGFFGRGHELLVDTWTASAPASTSD